MKQLQHFIIEKDIGGNILLIEDRELLFQMNKVLRYMPGDSCVLLDGKGVKAKALIKEIDKKHATVELIDLEKCKRPKEKIRLYCSPSKKPATFELIAQKACELGVDEIIPLVGERSQVSELRKTERLRLIMKEASEQCERCFLPELGELITLKDFLLRIPDGEILAGDAWDFDLKLKDVVKTAAVNILIGPEGGFSKAELDAIRKAGGRVFSLGDYVLRMETAAIAAISVVRFG